MAHANGLSISDNLEEIADCISEQLECPITIEDANHRILSYSCHITETDPARIATIIGRRVPENVINTLWEKGIIPLLQNSDTPVHIEKIEEIGLGNRVAISIRDRGEIIGYIWALEGQKSLQPEDFLILQEAAKIVKNKLLNNTSDKKNDINQELFWRLLNGYVKSEGEIADLLNQFQITPFTGYSIVIFRFATQINFKLKKQILYLLNTTQQIKIILYAINGSDLVLLVSLKDSDKCYLDFIENFRKMMGERFGVTNIRGSMGLNYVRLRNIPKSYKQALDVLEMQEKFPQETAHICSYEKLGVFQFLTTIYKKRQEEEFGNPFIKKVSQYDQKNNSEFLNTYEAFLDNNNDFTKTAQALHIHVNTLKYRLKRICEIGDIDINDFNQNLGIYIDLKIRRLK